MGVIPDTVNYILFTNPLSTGVKQLVKTTSSAVFPKQTEATSTVKIITERIPLYQLAQQAGPIVRLAGLSGAAAVILGAYGSHKSYSPEKGQELKRIFETANRFHFIHTLALLVTPLCRASKTSAIFLSMGMVLFSGTCYYHAFTGDNRFGRFAPIGGSCLILGWMAMIL